MNAKEAAALTGHMKQMPIAAHTVIAMARQPAASIGSTARSQNDATKPPTVLYSVHTTNLTEKAIQLIYIASFALFDSNSKSTSGDHLK